MTRHNRRSNKATASKEPINNKKSRLNCEPQDDGQKKQHENQYYH